MVKLPSITEDQYSALLKFLYFLSVNYKDNDAQDMLELFEENSELG